MYEEENPIRSDLWSTMDINELNIQRELVLNKIALLNQLSYTPTVINLVGALQQAIVDLDELLNYRFTETQPINQNRL